MGGAFSSPLSTRININKSDVCSQDSFALLTDKRWKSSREKMISRAGSAIHGLGQERIEIFLQILQDKAYQSASTAAYGALGVAKDYLWNCRALHSTCVFRGRWKQATC